jgi:NAD(P)-dependent dehydrogenase (short-subunit alcohol dehydrogenase family)
VLKNKKVVVVGGSSGIGLSTAKLACQEGAEVIIIGRTLEKLQKAQLEIGEAVQFFAADMQKENQMQQLFSQIGAFDHLVITAAQGITGEFLKLDVQTAKTGFEMKFWGTYVTAKNGIPYIREGGSVVFASGLSASKPSLGKSLTTAINCAIEGLARALALELGPLRVNVVSPALVYTPRWDQYPKEAKEKFFRMGEALPVRRIGQPEDLAQAIVFLMKSPFVTGMVLQVDGGMSLT